MTKAAFASIVLAAGKGTRMKSRKPKVLHAVAGRSMIGHVLACLESAGTAETILVTAPDQDEVRGEAADHASRLHNAIQENQLGTADAVKAARPYISEADLPAIVMYGDTPLFQAVTIQRIVETVREGSDIAVLGFHAADPTGYGRLLVDADGHVEAIREETEASAEERAVTLCNSGVMAFRSAGLLDLLNSIRNDNAKGEFYLTDIVEVAKSAGHSSVVVECQEEEVMGVNSRAQLATAEAAMQRRLRLSIMADGVTLVAPETVQFSFDTVIAPDVVIEPHVVIGPGVSIGSDTVVKAFSHLEGATIGEKTSVGPYARLRPGARLSIGSKIGNFVEVKNAKIEAGAKVNHLTYVGDARVGQGANIGAGTITCNYDGAAKHFTDIGAGAFVGSNSSLVAPVSVGDGAYVGSGSVITKDVAPGSLAVTRSKQIQKDGWAERKKNQQSKQDKGNGGKTAASGG